MIVVIAIEGGSSVLDLDVAGLFCAVSHLFFVSYSTRIVTSLFTPRSNMTFREAEILLVAFYI